METTCFVTEVAKRTSDIRVTLTPQTPMRLEKVSPRVSGNIYLHYDVDDKPPYTVGLPVSVEIEVPNYE